MAYWSKLDCTFELSVNAIPSNMVASDEHEQLNCFGTSTRNETAELFAVDTGAHDIDNHTVNLVLVLDV